MTTTVIYLLFTILLFAIGPIRWNIPSYPKLISVLLVYICFFAFGYVFQARKKMSNKSFMANERLNPDSDRCGFLADTFTSSISLVFTISCIYSIIRCSVLMIHLYGSIDFSMLFSFDLGESYFERLHSSVQGRWYVLALNLINVLDVFWYVLGIIYYKRLPIHYKLLLYVTILFNVLYNLMGGTMISWAIYIFRLIPFLFLESYRSSYSTDRKKKRKSKKRILLIAICVLLFIALFSVAQTSRSEYMGQGADVSYDDMVKLDGFIKEEKELPILGKAISAVDFYITNGYCGMAYALELPPEFTFGIGFSRDFASTVRQYTGFDVSSKIYPQRLENYCGWDNGQYWPSAFTWFASDWTFYGIPVLMFLFGMFLCNVWYSTLTENSIVSTTLFSWLWIGIIFIPANNQLFQSFSMFMATVVLMLLYLLRKSLPRPVWGRR